MDKQALTRLERFKARLESERTLLLAELEEWLRSKADLECITLLGRLTQLTTDELLEALQEIDSSKAKKYCSRLQALEASLCQLEIGLYGYCADCERGIEPELLQRDPTTQRCHDCHQHHLKKSKKKHKLLL